MSRAPDRIPIAMPRGFGRCASCGGLMALPTRAAGQRCGGRCGGTLRVADPETSIDALLVLARDTLRVDLAVLTEVAGGRETAYRAAGRWPGLAFVEGRSVSVDETFCGLLLAGRVENVVPDVAGDERARDLAIARDLGVGAWLGVALPTDDLRVYLLCGLAVEARPDLDEAAVQVLRAFAQTIAIELRRRPAPPYGVCASQSRSRA